jgi:hypothetical protein
MSDGLVIRRLYVDSRFRTAGTTSDFEIELQQGFELPANCHCYLAEFTGVVSWLTLNETNNNLYLGEKVGEDQSFRLVQLPLGAHDSESLRAVLQDSMNAGRPSGLGNYTVTRSSSAGSTATASLGSAAYRYYTVSLSSGKFNIVSDNVLSSAVFYNGLWKTNGGETYSPSDLKSSNELFSFEDPLSYQTSHVSKFIDLRSKHSLFLHSSLTNNDSIGPRNARSALAKIPVDAAYASVIHYTHGGSPYELTSVGPTFLRTIRFFLTDARNQVIDLQGSHWSATIIFCIA